MFPISGNMDNFSSVLNFSCPISGNMDNFDVVDERMSLLQAEGGAIHTANSTGSRPPSIVVYSKGDSVELGDGVSIASSASNRNKKLGYLLSHLGSKTKKGN
jgi:hypothetical protein